MAWLVLLLPAVVGSAQPTGVTAARYAPLARGVNMDNWFEYGSPFIVTGSDRDLLKHAGFTCIRLPVAPEYLLRNWASAFTIATNLTNLDHAIDLFVNAGMAVMLDFHADPEYLNYYFATPSAPQELISTWQMLATRYSNRNPDLLFFEIMNEPDNRFAQATWDVEQQEVLAAIHQIAPNHTVLVTPVNWSGLDALVQMTPYSDLNVIYVLHDYNPLAFTHQGATWVNSTAIASLRNVPYPSYLSDLQTLIHQTTDTNVLALLQEYQSEDWSAGRIDWDIRLAAAWASHWGVWLVVNEFGAYKAYSPPDSRARWIHDMHSSFDRYGLGWAMWDYGSGFDLIITNSGGRQIAPALSAALGFEPWTLPDPQRPGPPPPFTGLLSVELAGTPAGGYAEGLLVADLNADGLPDLIMTPINYPSLPEFSVQAFINQGGGVMLPATWDGAAPTQKFVSSIVQGKFDRSGRPGFFLPDNGPTNGSGAQSKLILPSTNNTLKDASSGLPQQIISTVGGAAGDVDNDGVDDLVVFYNSSPQRTPMQLLRNDGSGHFHADSQAFPAWVSDMSRGDNFFIAGTFLRRRDQPINDLVVVGWGGAGQVFLNDGTGHFSTGAALPAPTFPNGGPAMGGCTAVADLNGDGCLDVIVAYCHRGAGQPDGVQILINNGDGTFRDESKWRIGWPLPNSQYGLRRVSLAAANNGQSRALVLIRPGDPPLLRIDRGDGVFVSTSAWSPPAATPWVAAGGDFNGDGLLDLAFGEGGNGPSIQLRFGQSAPPTDGPVPVALGQLTLSITLSNGQPHLVWNSVPSWRYQVQYKLNLNDASWTDLGSVLTASTNMTELVDTLLGADKPRFYRLVER
jgi:aryl-phospho-beta-D-glucosidase BglC (GH1 family)